MQKTTHRNNFKANQDYKQLVGDLKIVNENLCYSVEDYLQV